MNNEFYNCLAERLRDIARTVDEWEAPIGARPDLFAAARELLNLRKQVCRLTFKCSTKGEKMKSKNKKTLDGNVNVVKRDNRNRVGIPTWMIQALYMNTGCIMVLVKGKPLSKKGYLKQHFTPGDNVISEHTVDGWNRFRLSENSLKKLGITSKKVKLTLNSKSITVANYST